VVVGHPIEQPSEDSQPPQDNFLGDWLPLKQLIGVVFYSFYFSYLGNRVVEPPQKINLVVTRTLEWSGHPPQLSHLSTYQCLSPYFSTTSLILLDSSLVASPSLISALVIPSRRATLKILLRWFNYSYLAFGVVEPFQWPKRVVWSLLKVVGGNSNTYKDQTGCNTQEN
jgi:hypothetical protein